MPLPGSGVTMLQPHYPDMAPRQRIFETILNQ